MSEGQSRAGRFELIAEKRGQEAQALEATHIALGLLTGNRSVVVDDIPLLELVARELKLDSPHKVKARHDVGRLLMKGTEVVGAAAGHERHMQEIALSIASGFKNT